MKLWLAEVIEVGGDFLCALLGHFYGCWLVNHRWSPLRPLHRWAVEVNFRAHPPRHCGQEPNGTAASDPFSETYTTGAPDGTVIVTHTWRVENA